MDKVSVDVQVMKTSAGADYYVRIMCGDRETTPHMFKDRYKAEYHVDHYKWLFGLREEDADVMSYDETTHPNLY